MRGHCSDAEKRGYAIVSGGTDNHLAVDLRQKGLTAIVAEAALGRARLTCQLRTIIRAPGNDRVARAFQPSEQCPRMSTTFPRVAAEFGGP